MALTLVEALSTPKPCRCQCHQRMSVAERTQGVVAMMRFDDAVRGWGYQPLYEPRARFLFDEAKRNNDQSYRAVAVKDEACNYARLVGFAVHEIIHGLCGEIGKSNWGVPWGLPYGVPEDLAEGDEADYLEPYNFAEACAWAGIAVVAKALFDIEWPLRGARDVGTYGFAGGNAICPVPPGFRQVPHIDRQHSPDQYYRKARVLEAEARAFMDEARLSQWRQRFEEGEAAGVALREQPFPDARKLAAQMPSKPGRNEPCICGSGQKYKRCCGR